ncbi:MAG: slipin family protein [Spirochaetales bacterium]|nr:slipin family protein [Spirochaetales bacterium]
MALGFVRLEIKTNHLGYLYRNHKLQQKLEPGIYHFFDPRQRLQLIAVPSVARELTVINQEVLSQDNMALRLSFMVEYLIVDGQKALETYVPAASYEYHLAHSLVAAEEHLRGLTQIALRNRIATLDIAELNAKRHLICVDIEKEINAELEKSGLAVKKVNLRDLTFPKAVQDLFTRQLTAQIRARADLENARTQVAAARALKNAAELMKGDDNLRFLQFIETLKELGMRGSHTFVVGDYLRPDRKDGI